MAERYVVSHNGQEVGPFTNAEIAERVRLGQLQVTDYMYDPALNDWILLAERFSSALPPKPAKPLAPIAPGVPSHAQDTPPPAPVANLSRPSSVIAAVPQVPPPMATKAPTPVPSPTPTPAPVSPKVAPAPTPAAATLTGGTLEIRNGMGQFDLSVLKAGSLELQITDRPAEVKSPDKLAIQVHPAPAVRIQWSGDSQSPAAKENRFSLKALDPYGNVDTNFNQEAMVHVQGPHPREIAVSFHAGIAELSWQESKAGAYWLELRWKSICSVTVPDRRQFEVHPGPVVELVIESPRELKAGEKGQITVRAVDAHGNLATDFTGSLKLKSAS